jgi:hypothetical protein
MVAAVPNPRPLPTEPAPRRRRATGRLTPVAVPNSSSQHPKASPEAIALPPGLRRLQAFQRWSLIGCLSAGFGILGLYGFTALQQHNWGTNYSRLEHLRRQELRLIAANAVLRDQILQQVEHPQSGLIPAHSSDLVFLRPAPPRPTKPINLGAPGTLPTGSPIGY